ncbi:hypothetical protein [Mycoplasma sp. SG1]|uniref:hypothetical protein n=1 Tax=Mycoplasma sp. SG1 TaxID=2810348 RepID=UPI002023DC12|nr:hypothetical protein [Mycoplasma sp. SG1]URM53030.1 hypothetical protein JRW51_01645 [Mycoplasma sp. SG1]
MENQELKNKIDNLKKDVDELEKLCTQGVNNLTERINKIDDLDKDIIDIKK